MRRLFFVPIYKQRLGEKEISKLYLKYNTRGVTKIVDVIDIESEGITLLEFLDYIISNGAKEIKDPGQALEIM